MLSEIRADGGGHLTRDGAPHQIISGALHYARVPAALWADRLARIAAMGCNTVETYVPWNFHQPHAGAEADFSGDRDLGRFLDLAADADLDILVRPGPYICAEWDMGGLPSWLLTDAATRANLRTAHPAFLAAVDAWFDALIPVVATRQVSGGGRVVGVQVENEYGSYGNDGAYLQHLRDGLIRRGIDVLLFTSDGPSALHLAGGTLADCWPTVNFGSRQEQAFGALQQFRPGSANMCMEFWNGWFDHWGAPHHVRDAAHAAAELRAMLTAGASVNFYMAHGGTSFGVWAGANSYPDENGPDYSPTITSYDYDAPIAEDGTLTEKFAAFRDVIAAHTGIAPPAAPPSVPVMVPLPAAVSQRLPLDRVLDAQPLTHHATPASLEELGLHHGVVRYRTTAAWPDSAEYLHAPELADLASVSIDGEYVARLRRAGLAAPDPAYQTAPFALAAAALEAGDASAPATGAGSETGTGPVSEAGSESVAGSGAESEPAAHARPRQRSLEVLVHSLGRVNFGRFLPDAKGLGPVLVDFQHLFGWDHSALDLTELPDLDWTDASTTGSSATASTPAAGGQPAFHRVPIEVDTPGSDAHLDMSGWGHGYVFLNGFNLGRYWSEAGPQRSLYAPAPLWREGTNEVVILEFTRAGTHLAFADSMILGEPLETAT